MGNTQSTNPKKDESDIYNIVNHIASNYIFTSNFQDMQNLNDVNYCNNLVILTSRIIEENLNDLDIEYLSQHIKEGKVVDIMTKDKVIYLKKDNIPKLDVKNDTQKRRLCVGIAKFYVKVAHIFACIMKTINPTISYSDNAGQTKEVDITEKHTLPDKDKDDKLNMKMNMSSITLCSKRLDALVNNNKYDTGDLNKEITVNPDYCGFNAQESNSDLHSEPGMVELEQLYNDKYNYDTGGYNGMSDNMKKQYQRDLKIFYEAFSDNNEPFDDKKITKFSDIKLREHHKKEGCSKSDKGEYLQKYKDDYKNELFFKYAKHIKAMMENTKKNQDKLLSVIDKLFVFVNIEDDAKKVTKMILINPELTEKSLQTVVEDTRNIIINLYITCENDFLKGLEIFEGIVEQKISDNTKERINNLPLHRELLRTKEKQHGEENHSGTHPRSEEKQRSEDETNNIIEKKDEGKDKNNNIMDMLGFNKNSNIKETLKDDDDDDDISNRSQLEQSNPRPSEPRPSESRPSEPSPDESRPSEPKPDEPKPDEPKPDEPKPDERSSDMVKDNEENKDKQQYNFFNFNNNENKKNEDVNNQNEVIMKDNKEKVKNY